MSRFDTFVDRVNALGFGAARVTDYFPTDGRRPYRYAQLMIDGVDAARFVELAAALGPILIDADAHLTYFAWSKQLSVQLSRDLTEEEATTNVPAYATRDVTT